MNRRTLDDRHVNFAPVAVRLNRRAVATQAGGCGFGWRRGAGRQEFGAVRQATVHRRPRAYRSPPPSGDEARAPARLVMRCRPSRPRDGGRPAAAPSHPSRVPAAARPTTGDPTGRVAAEYEPTAGSVRSARPDRGTGSHPPSRSLRARFRSSTCVSNVARTPGEDLIRVRSWPQHRARRTASPPRPVAALFLEMDCGAAYLGEPMNCETGGRADRRHVAVPAVHVSIL
jgi:hypothetical protein